MPAPSGNVTTDKEKTMNPRRRNDVVITGILLFSVLVTGCKTVNATKSATVKNQPQSTLQTEDRNAIIFEDDFKNNGNKWPAYYAFKNTSYAKAEVKNGSLTINNYKPHIFNTWQRIDIDENEGFEIGTLIKQTEGDNKQNYGIVYGGSDWKHYFVFFVTGEGNAVVRKFVYPSFSNLGIAKNKIIKGKEKINELRIRKKGDLINYIVNGTIVLAVKKHPTFFGDLTGLVVNSPKIKVESDYFVVKQFARQTSPLTNGSVTKNEKLNHTDEKKSISPKKLGRVLD